MTNPKMEVFRESGQQERQIDSMAPCPENRRAVPGRWPILHLKTHLDDAKQDPNPEVTFQKSD
jgi:hypothetical protein